MKEIKVKLYSFDELSDDAKENAIENAQEENCNFYWDNVSEEISALSDIAYAIGVDNKAIDYSFSTCSPSYIKFSFHDIADELKDIRALKYIYNNFISPFIKGKYYSIGKYIDGKYHYKYKNSRAIKEFSSASGTYIDFTVYDVYADYIEKVKKHISFNVNNFIQDLENRLCKIILKVAEEYNSEEYWRERLSNDNEEIYNEDGTIYKR